MAKMQTFTDDFVFPGLDRSLWAAAAVGTSGTLTFPAGGGMQLYPAASGQYMTVTSRTSYDMTDSFCRIQLGGQYGLLLTNTAAEASFTLYRDADSFAVQMFVYYSSGWKLEARAYSTTGTPITLAGTITVAWNPVSQRNWRIIRSTATSKIYWQYSSDGITWRTLAYQLTSVITTAMTAMKVKLTAGDGATAGQYFNIRRVNTYLDIDRGEGYVNDTFDRYPRITIPAYSTTPPEQFGPWINKSGTQSIVDDPGGEIGAGTIDQNVLSLVGGVGATATILTRLGSVIKDIDFTCKVRIQAQTASPSSRICWRVDSTEANYWYLKFTTTQTILGYFSGAADHDVSTFTTNMGTLKYWTYRIIHVGSELAVFTDTGYGTAGYGYPTVELTPRQASNANVPDAGSVGFKSTSQTTYVKDVKVGNGVTPPAPGSWTPAEPVQHKPWTGDRTATASNLEYLRLEDDFGNVLNIMPSYGDIVLKDANLGSPVGRAVVKQRPAGNGATSYTQYHGEKSVALSLAALKTTFGEARFYSDLVQQWVRPGWKSKLVYKPRGAAERYINVEGTSLGRGTITAVANQKIDLDVVLLAPDGKDYESAEQTVTLTAGTVGYAVSAGTLQTEPVIRILGPCVNPVFYDQTVEAYYPGQLARLGLTVTLDSSEYVDLVVKTREVRYMGLADDAASYRQFLTIRNWFSLEPGRNALLYTSDDVSGTARVNWHNAF